MWKVIVFAILILGCSTTQVVAEHSSKEHCVNGYVKYECVDPNVGEGLCLKKDEKGATINCSGW